MVLLNRFVLLYSMWTKLLVALIVLRIPSWVLGLFLQLRLSLWFSARVSSLRLFATFSPRYSTALHQPLTRKHVLFSFDRRVRRRITDLRVVRHRRKSWVFRLREWNWLNVFYQLKQSSIGETKVDVRNGARYFPSVKIRGVRGIDLAKNLTQAETSHHCRYICPRRVRVPSAWSDADECSSLHTPFANSHLNIVGVNPVDFIRILLSWA